MIPDLEKLETSLADARFELSPTKAKSTFKEVLRYCEEAVRSGTGVGQHRIIGSAACSDLAALELSGEHRLGYRRKAIKILGSDAEVSADLLVSRANRTVDLFYDPYAKESPAKVRSMLARASKILRTAASRESFTLFERARLLEQRSSVLRCQAKISNSAEAEKRVTESVRCATRAVELSESDVFAHVELGQAYWARARFAKSDEECFDALKEAEESLLKARSGGEPLALVVLSRFFRQSYRPAQAIEFFREYSRREGSNRRRILQEAFLMGEAAMLLWYRDYESSLVEDALEEARRVLLDAVEAGYEVARNYTSLAFVQAALGDPKAAESVLMRLCSGEIRSWMEVIGTAEAAVATDDISIITNAFALGVDQGIVWNSLGTYASRFLKDEELALRLYSVGRRLSPRNHVILTNLGRLLVRAGSEEQLLEAKTCLSRAANFAPRTFVWWRAIQKDLEAKRGHKRRPPPLAVLDRRPERIQFRDIQKRYRALKAAAEDEAVDSQRRGYVLQEIVHDLIKVCFGAQEVEGSHQVLGRQVDAAFTYRNVRHRVEVKWRSKPLDQSHLDAANAWLRQAEVRGLFVSMSGFTDQAVEAARRFGESRALLLMNGGELDKVIDGRVRLESLLEWKLAAWRKTGEPYANVTDLETEE